MAEPGQETGEKSSKKLIIIAAAVILLVVGISIGATVFLMKGSSSKEGKVEEVKEVHEELLYFNMDKPIVVDFSKNSMAKHGRITIAMQVEGAETIAALKKNEPMIQNNMLMLIGAQDPANLNTREGKEALSKSILDDVNAVLKKMAGKGQVDEIFFTSFIMQ
jgi:flagellar FliL protein